MVSWCRGGVVVSWCGCGGVVVWWCCVAILAQAILLKPLGEVHSGVVVFVSIFASPSAVPRCEGWTSMDVPSGGSRLCATTVGEVGTHEASGEWFGAEWASGSLALFSCLPRSSHHTGSRPGCVQEGDQRVIKLEPRCAQRLREVATLKSSLQKALQGANRFRVKLRRPRHSFLVPRNVCLFWKRNARASKSCWTKRC